MSVAKDEAEGQKLFCVLMKLFCVFGLETPGEMRIDNEEK